MIDMFGQKYKLPKQFNESFLKDYYLMTPNQGK